MRRPVLPALLPVPLVPPVRPVAVRPVLRQVLPLHAPVSPAARNLAPRKS